MLSFSIYGTETNIFKPHRKQSLQSCGGKSYIVTFRLISSYLISHMQYITLMQVLHFTVGIRFFERDQSFHNNSACITASKKMASTSVET